MNRALLPTVAAAILMVVAPAFAEGPQERALDSGQDPSAVASNPTRPVTHQSAPIKAGLPDDPSQVQSHPTQVEPAHEGPEERALDRALKNAPDGDKE